MIGCGISELGRCPVLALPPVSGELVLEREDVPFVLDVFGRIETELLNVVVGNDWED